MVFLDKFDFFSPLDYRYVKGSLREKAASYFSENARVRYQARVEAALVQALAKQGVCSKKVADEVSKAAENVRAIDVYEEEKRIKHDVRALVNVMRSMVSDEAKPFIHFSATSYDIVDTASALRYKEGTKKLLVPVLKDLLRTWIDIALREKNSVQIGRTHGQHAEPITFGFAMCSYINRLGKGICLISDYADNLEGKFSGAVGAYNASSLLVKDPVKLEKDIMDSLGLKQGLHSTQIVEPESLINLVNSLFLVFDVLANFSDDMRHLQRTEIAEVFEAFGADQVGSSTMPHKRNPISFENVKSLWKAFLPRLVTLHLDAVSEHQRDLTNSASARFVPEIFLSVLVCAERLKSVCNNLKIDSEAMRKNFELSKNFVVAEPLYVLLAKHGHPNSHEIVRKLTLKVSSSESLFDLASEDESIKPYLKKFSAEELSVLKNPEKYYTGVAIRKTEEVCDYWVKRFF